MWRFGSWIVWIFWRMMGLGGERVWLRREGYLGSETLTPPLDLEPRKATRLDLCSQHTENCRLSRSAQRATTGNSRPFLWKHPITGQCAT
jgi:hypothetical protein